MDGVTTEDGKRFAGLGGSGGGTKFGDVKMAGSACEAGGGGGSGLCFVLTRFTTVAWERNQRKLLPSVPSARKQRFGVFTF